MSKRLQRLGTLVLALALVAGCATGQAVHSADQAAAKGDWDTAVAFYRQAIEAAPSRTDLKIKLERATTAAAAQHVKRARQLEAEDQLPGAVAEYKLAADLDPSSPVAASKAMELERKIRQQVEAARPQGRIDTLRQQAAQSSPIPRLDPRTPLRQLHLVSQATRDILRTISDLTGINIKYDQGLDAILSRPNTLDVQDESVEEVLNDLLQTNALTFKIQNAHTIFIYADNNQNRAKYEEQYMQQFYLSNIDPTELQTSLNALFNGINLAVRPVFTPNKATNILSVRATAPVMDVIAKVVASMDRPIPEVIIQAEILEVDRNFVRSIGLDLNQWALGLAFSPEVAPAVSAGTIPPPNPPAFNLNTISRGVSANDFYATTPGAMIKLLESNTNTRVLARPSNRGQAGSEISLKLGDQIPIPTTVFQSGAAGGVANIPTTSVQYQSVGINLVFTPRVTYQDEIVLEKLTLEKSGLGANLDVGGQSFPTIVSRQTNTTLRLRDGESTMIAGLLRDDEQRAVRSLPGLSGIPVIRSIFGNSEKTVDQTDIVMIITPHIVRGHDVTAEDLRPMSIGTGTNVGASNGASLSFDALQATIQALGATAVQGGPGPGAPPVQTVPTPAAATSNPVPSPSPSPSPTPQGVPATTPRAPGVVPIQPVPSPAAPAATPPATGTRITLTAPPNAAAGLPSGGGPYTVPIQITDASDVATIALSITYDPSVVTRATVTQGSFMMQDGAQVTFVPSVNTVAGRIDVVISRPTTRPGASNSGLAPGLVAAISFTPGTAGSTDFTVSGIATTTTGQAIPLQFTPTRVTVR